MSPFFALFQGHPVMVIAIVSGKDGPDAVVIHGDGWINAYSLRDIRIDLQGAWRPTDWPSWPPSEMVDAA